MPLCPPFISLYTYCPRFVFPFVLGVAKFVPLPAAPAYDSWFVFRSNCNRTRPSENARMVFYPMACRLLPLSCRIPVNIWLLLMITSCVFYITSHPVLVLCSCHSSQQTRRRGKQVTPNKCLTRRKLWLEKAANNLEHKNENTVYQGQEVSSAY